jgi:hypothetical protein
MRLLAGSKNMTGFGEPEAGPLWLWLLPPPLKYIDDWDEVGGWPGGGPWWKQPDKELGLTPFSFPKVFAFFALLATDTSGPISTQIVPFERLHPTENEHL